MSMKGVAGAGPVGPAFATGKIGGRAATAITLLALLVASFGCRGDYAEAAPSETAGSVKSAMADARSAPHEASTTVSVRLSEWKLVLSRWTAPAGEVEFTVTNAGTMLHAFEIEGQGMEKEVEPIAAGATSTLRVTLPPGSYEVYCPIGNGKHKKMGMIAHIEVLGEVDLKKLVAGMKQGGYVIVLRHAATNSNQADTDPLHPANVAQQRRLNAEGKEAATHLGEAFARLGIPLGKVYSSEFDRAVETAKLVSGRNPTRTLDVTEGGLVVTPEENQRRTDALKAMACTRPEAGKNTLIVTHKPNILDAFGESWFKVKEGEASVFKPDGSGKPVLVARVQAAEWLEVRGR
jgi:phosphohistidine phosphatase SixA/plastocyanin